MIVSDTTPINYLVLIDAVDVLPTIYGNVAIPPAVREELFRSGAPSSVRNWLAKSPAWLKVIVPVTQPDASLSHLDAGEIQRFLWRRSNRRTWS